MTIEYQNPIPLNFKRGDISLIADKLYQKLSFRNKSLEDAVKDLNGKVVYLDGLENYSFPSITITPKGFVVNISKDSSPLRDRRTLATALGHWVLHYLFQNQNNNKQISYLKVDNEAPKETITEALWFGSSLMMPKIEYMSVHKRYEGNHLLISNHFKVTFQSSVQREKSLKEYLSQNTQQKVKLGL